MPPSSDCVNRSKVFLFLSFIKGFDFAHHIFGKCHILLPSIVCAHLVRHSTANAYTYFPPALAFETIVSRVTDPSSVPKVSDKVSPSKKRRLTTQKNFPLAFQA